MKPKVLILDDEYDLASALAERLSIRDYNACSLHNPKDLLSSMDKVQPDVLIMDISLGTVSGIDILASVSHKYPDCPVIIMTGVADENIHNNALTVGAFKVLIKPVDISVLTDAIDNAVSQSTFSDGHERGDDHN